MSDFLYKLVFLDETAVNTDLIRRYGRSIGQSRVVDKIPLNKPNRLTILGSMRWDGSISYITYTGGTTGKQFVSYLKDTLVPTLHEGDIVVMDNVSMHLVKGVREAVKPAKAEVLYLPPYSPDLNPIEMLWSKLKSILRKMRIRVSDELPKAVESALKQILPTDCQNWFKHDGYCL